MQQARFPSVRHTSVLVQSMNWARRKTQFSREQRKSGLNRTLMCDKSFHAAACKLQLLSGCVANWKSSLVKDPSKSRGFNKTERMRDKKKIDSRKTWVNWMAFKQSWILNTRWLYFTIKRSAGVFTALKIKLYASGSYDGLLKSNVVETLMS